MTTKTRGKPVPAPAAPAEETPTTRPSAPPLAHISFDELPASADAPVTQAVAGDPLEDTPAFVKERLTDSYSQGRTTPAGKWVPKWKLQNFHTPEQAAEFVRLAKRYAKAADRSVSIAQVRKVSDTTYTADEKGTTVRYSMRPKIHRPK